MAKFGTERLQLITQGLFFAKAFEHFADIPSEARIILQLGMMREGETFMRFQKPLVLAIGLSILGCRQASDVNSGSGVMHEFGSTAGDKMTLDSPEIMMQPLAIEQCYA